MNKEKTILGIMSGTSLDGIDFALCNFAKKKDTYTYKVIQTGFVPYDASWKNKLAHAQNLNSFDFIKLHKAYGRFIGKQANAFLQGAKLPDFIASHGHTVFHKPQEQITFQIGDGAFIAAETNIATISDFRNLDTAFGGQGAPLVPIGDKLLFSEFDFCLNLGGFANISDKKNAIAYDLCPFNFILNHFAQKAGKEYDENGEIGKTGKIHGNLLDELKQIDYYRTEPPKSLGREYVEKYYFPIFEKYTIPAEDFIRTYYEHAAACIYESIADKNDKKVLITGGGAHNTFFLSLLKKISSDIWYIPDKNIIDYKEAIIFAFLAFLRSRQEINTCASVTGAKKNTSGGCIFLPE